MARSIDWQAYPMRRAKTFQTYSNLAKLFYFFKVLDIKLSSFFVPALLTFLSIMFESINTFMLIPLTKGLVTMSFTFSSKVPFLNNILYALFPPDRSFISTMASLVLLLIIINVLKTIIQYLSSLASSRQCAVFSYRMRRLLFERYLSFGKLFFDRWSQSHLSDLITSISGSVARNLMSLQGAIMSFVMLAVYLCFMLAISWKMTILLILIYSFQNYISKILFMRIAQTSTAASSAQRNLSLKIFNILSCVPLVKAYNKEEIEKENFAAINKRINDLQLDMDKKSALIRPFNEVGMQATFLLLILGMVYLVAEKGAGNLAIFLVFFYVAKRCSDSFNAVMGFNSGLSRATGNMALIAEIFDDEGKYFVWEGREKFTGLKDRIEFKHLSFCYSDGVCVLNDINCFIRKGEMTALVGPTGAGKTTIINLLLRFYDCPPSSIFIDKTDIRVFSLKSIRSHFAFVGQDVLLLNATIKENILYGIDGDIDDGRLNQILEKSQLREFIMNLPEGLNTHVGDRGIKLSGGEKQRISIARALLKNSEILLLDEATSSLDSKTEKLIQLAVEELIKGRTTIVIAHRFSTIKNAQNIIVIDHGKIIEEGALADLINSKGRFFEYWQEQKFF